MSGGGGGSGSRRRARAPTAAIASATTPAANARPRFLPPGNSRLSTFRSDSEPTRRRPRSGGISPAWGTAITLQPAAVAERTPVGESSRATQSCGDTFNAFAAARYGSGGGRSPGAHGPPLAGGG